MARRKIARNPMQPVTVSRLSQRERGFYETQDTVSRLPVDEDLLGKVALRTNLAHDYSDSLAPAWGIQSDLDQYRDVLGSLRFAVLKEAYRPIVEAGL